MDNNARVAARAGNMIPGVAPVNWLNRMLGNMQSSANRPVTPRSRALDAQRSQQLRRSRLAMQLQNDARAAGRPALSENEVNAHLRTMGID